ncbi:52 kDa repressor of the inhibitor of the protein kinase-like [Solea senegalensis]|uniref:52 kDa repressor of the inhibitor of the protein kinase-like n=3 Tax=Solea senegalensis TaxID=28829 RepID=A0AAV6PLE8_SOLSE|nr:THAP domain containing 12b [Solea senegalensis]KAG7465562.1 52 kDa repressor of the inhibitor of the protein kinase-like [Solea senegalensis]
MPNFCAAPNCTRKSTQSDLAFFRFPRDPERCRIWVENCRRADLEAKTSDQLNKHYRLCAKHFDPAMVCKTSPYRTVLKDTAIPTIFDLTSHLKKPHTRHRKQIKELTEEDIRKMKERRLASSIDQLVSKKDAAAEASSTEDEPQLSTEDREFREYLRSLFEVVVVLGKQSIPLMSDRATEAQHKSNNFQALLDYRINAGDEALKKRFEATAVNGEFLSETQQHQLLDVCENTVREEMLMEVRESRFFSLVTGDLVQFSGEKHLPLFLRFVNQQNVLREEFLDFVVFDGDEASLVEKLEAQLTERWGLSMEDCRGQAHKATGTSTIKMKAVATLLMEKYPLAFNMPCSHMALNIHLANSLPYPNVQVVMETMRRIGAFFRIPFTQAELHVAISTHFQKNEEKAAALMLACGAGWTEQHSVFDLLLDLFLPLLLCMDRVWENADGKFADSVAADAYSIAEILADFEIIVTVVILKNVLTFTRAFGRNLQRETLDVFFAANSLTAVLHSLNEVNDNIDVYHEFWFEEAVSLASVMEIPVKLPRLFLRKQRGADVDEIQVESYFQEYVTVPVLRGIMQEVEDMFSENNIKALKCLSLVPAVMGQMKFNTTEENYADVYRNDLPNPDTLPAELHCWRIKWKHRGKEVRLPTTIHETLQLPDVKFFPNVDSFLKVLSTFPVLKLEENTSDTASERLQVYLGNVAPALRNKSLAMLRVNTHVKHDLDVMVDKYCRLYPEDEDATDATEEDAEVKA